MDISLGIITLEPDISGLLESISKQRLNKARIKEIFVVAPEQNKDAMLESAKKNKLEIILIAENARSGKYNAINLFLNRASHEICVLCSGDIILDNAAVEQLALPLLEKNIGVTGARPMPVHLDTKKPLDYTIALYWHLHHEISRQIPKFGEMIAFRNLGFSLPPTEVDEEMIAALVEEHGFLKHYSSQAIIYNRGPLTASDYLRRSRRIYAGHLDLTRRYSYRVPTADLAKICRHLLTKRFHPYILYAIALEGAARAAGYINYLSGRRELIWPQIKKYPVKLPLPQIDDLH